jgi:hypothetical protein
MPLLTVDTHLPVGIQPQVVNAVPVATTTTTVAISDEPINHTSDQLSQKETDLDGRKVLAVVLASLDSSLLVSGQEFIQCQNS